MARRLNDDEIMDYTFNKLFGDLDKIRSGSMFSDKAEAVEGAADNAGIPGMEGISITVKPMMAAAAESGRPPESGEEVLEEPEIEIEKEVVLGLEDEDEEEKKKKDRYRGIGAMSPLMSQLHGDR